MRRLNECTPACQYNDWGASEGSGIYLYSVLPLYVSQEIKGGGGEKDCVRWSKMMHGTLYIDLTQ